MSLSSLLVNTCTVQRWASRARSASDYTLEPIGGSYEELTTGVPCNIQEKGGNESVTIAGLKVSFNAVAYLEPGVDLKMKSADNQGADRVVVTSPATGAVYYVVGVVDQVGRQKFKKAFLESRS